MRAVRAGALVLALAVGAAPVSAEAWSRGYVVEWIEHAAHYPGKPEALKAPAADCPKGTEPELDLRKLLKTSYRSDAEIAQIIDPEARSKGFKGESLFEAMTKRGLKGENIYRNPKSAPDPGMFEMEGKVSEGFDLDGDPKTGFTGPKGEKGIDNRFYKAWGCWESFRGPHRKSMGALYHNDEMRNGKFTVLILISGNQSPQNDEDVQLGFYTSRDKVVKDANGEIAPHYSFRIADDKVNASVLKARIRNGELTLSEPQDIRTREASFLARLTLLKGQARLSLNADGSLSGMIGGYKPIEEAISTWTIAGPNVELVSHVNLSAAYYAIERNADHARDEATGLNTAISTAMRLWAVPAFIIKPDGSGVASVAQAYSGAPGAAR
jgi:hypothetical protein